MLNLEKTIASQYANSPTINSLIKSLNDAIDPSADINSFYANMWNINTAVGYGLDCWGRFVGVPRVITTGLVNGAQVGGPFFGFKDSTGSNPFGQGVFYSYIPVSNNYSLLDGQYRQLILLKAYSNITRCTIPVLNKILMLMFPGIGNVRVLNIGNMTIEIASPIALSQFQQILLNQTNVFNLPCGVSFTFVVA
jgi:hypothetical protein